MSKGVARDIKFSITYWNMSLPQDRLIVLFFDRKGRLTLKITTLPAKTSPHKF